MTEVEELAKETRLYIICDAKGTLAALRINLFGANRGVIGVFVDETEALEVGARLEQSTGIPHLVKTIRPQFSLVEPGERA